MALMQSRDTPSKAATAAATTTRAPFLFLLLGVAIVLVTSLTTAILSTPPTMSHEMMLQQDATQDFLHQVTAVQPQPQPQQQQQQQLANERIQQHDRNQSVINTTPNNGSSSSSSFEFVSPGMLLYHNVCLVQNNTQFVDKKNNGNHTKTRLTMKLRTYSVHGTGFNVWQPQDTQFRAGNYRFLYQTEGGTLQEWQETTSQGVLVKEPTLFTLQLFHNPGHCLSDLVFSLAWDRFHRRQQEQQQQQRPATRPFYPRFVYGTWQQVRTTPYQPDWCFEVMRLANFIHVDTMIRHKSSVDDSVCFAQLYVPILGLHRFPIGHDDDDDDDDDNDNDNDNNMDDTSLQAFQQLSVMKMFHTHDYTTAAWRYPVAALQELQTQIMQGAKLDHTPWPVKDDNDDDVLHNTTILLYNRQGSARRHWINADQVQIMLERDYAVQIDRLGAEWESFHTTRQLQMYNQYSHILTVHGAQEANLIAARPHTKIIEIQCVLGTDPQPNVTATSVKEAQNTVAWYGPPSWYTTFTNRLNMSHFLYTETTGCRLGNSNAGVHGASQIMVNVTQLVSFCASRWNLRRRGRGGVVKEE